MTPTSRPPLVPFVVAFLLLDIWTSLSVDAKTSPTFVTEGPVLTLTLKDPDDAESPFRPNLLYSIVSQRPPFPNHFPALRSLQAAIGYKPSPMSPSMAAPTFVEAVSKLDLGKRMQLQCQSSYDLPSKTFSSIVQAVRGSNYALVRFAGRTPVEVKASGYRGVPHASLSSIRITPFWTRESGMDVQVEAVSGGAGRTKFLYQRNVLSVQYQADANQIIRPEIHLGTGRIVYQYMNQLPNGGSFRLSVDPSKAIDATWVDPGAMGSWVTDVKLPMDGSTKAPQIRIRRFFQF